MTKQKKMGLTNEHRSFIVQRLATFMSPSETAEAVKEEFGLSVSRQAMERYDPNKRAGQRLGKQWRKLFALAREAFLKEVSDSVPLAHKAVRVRELSRAARAYKDSKNYMAMAKLLEQIAKEIGNSFSNRTELTGARGGPIRYADVGDMTDEQIRDELLSYGIDPALVHTAPTTKQ